MSLIVWVIFGTLAGWIASIIAGISRRQDIASNIIIGIIGATLGGFMMSVISQSEISEFNLYSAIVAILGSVFLLGVYRIMIIGARDQ